MNNNDDAPPILRPDIENHDVIKKMLKDNYGLSAITLKPLNGYDDLNFHINPEPEHCNPHIAEISPHGYFLKVVNEQDSKSPEMQYAQKKVMDHLNAAGVPCQTAVKGLNGEDFTELTTDVEGRTATFMISIRSFIPGMLLADAKFSPQLCFQLGQLVARISNALNNFHDSFYDNFDPLWGMDQIHQVSKVTNVIQNEHHRKISEAVLEAFKKEVIPRKDQYKKGQIHGDPNEQNILVTTCEGGSGYEVCGLIDFQDCACTYPIYDLTISMAYMMMVPELGMPLVDVAGHMLAGYTSLLKLNEAEEKSLKILIAARMVMSLSYGAYTFSLDPTNVYSLTTGKAGWKALEEIWGTSEEKMKARFEDILKSY